MTIDLIRYLLQSGATSNFQERMMLFNYIVDNNTNVSNGDTYNAMFMSYAVTLGNMELINSLIERIRVEDRLTPIHYAVQWKNNELIKLIDLGYNVNAQAGPDEITPLHMAVKATVGN